MSNLRLARIAFALVLSTGTGCSGRRSAVTETTPSSTTSVSRSGDETQVTVEEASAEPVNPVCLSYCDRVAACWHARPNPDLMLTKDEIVKRCHSEQAACRTPTTDMLCCSEIADCYDFNRCVADSRDTVMSCGRVRPQARRRAF